MELSRTSRDCMKRRKKKKKEKKEERSCQLFRHGAGYCAVNKISSAHVTITLVVNGSTGWLYIYIYIFRKFERKLPSISVEIGFEKKRPWENLFYGGIGKKKKKKLFDRTKWDGTISRECKLELLFNYFLVYSCVL